MIEKIYTYKPGVINSSSTSLFLLMAVLLTVQKYSKISLWLLQIYVWGLLNDDNRLQVIRWRTSNNISTTPWLDNINQQSVITQCLSNNLLKLETTKNGKINIELGASAYIILADVDNLDLTREIKYNLASMGRLTDTMIGNLQLEF